MRQHFDASTTEMLFFIPCWVTLTTTENVNKLCIFQSSLLKTDRVNGFLQLLPVSFTCLLTYLSKCLEEDSLGKMSSFCKILINFWSLIYEYHSVLLRHMKARQYYFYSMFRTQGNSMCFKKVIIEKNIHMTKHTGSGESVWDGKY